MPTYEYVCRDCAEHLEVVQSFHDDPLKECGRCGGALRKVFNAAGIIFKGSGYYVTDTRAAEGAASSGKGNGSKESADSSTSESSSSAESSKDGDNSKADSSDRGSSSGSGEQSSSDGTSSSNRQKTA